MDRRNFLGISASIGAGALSSPFDPLLSPFSASKPTVGYRLLVFATNWGYSGSWADFCQRIKEAGYDGAELWYPHDKNTREEILTVFQRYGLQLGFLVGGSDANFLKHLEQFKSSLEAAAILKPVYINCHSGRDFFSFDQNKAFIDLGVEVSRQSGVPVYHETHRSRILFAAPVARNYIEQIPDLKLTLDISHWCNVHESLLNDQEETVALALERAGHIHARIGHPEGPQVNDPRAPEWAQAVQRHFYWWDQVVERKRKAGEFMTILTEFGPAGYLPTLPYTQLPVADQWQINKYMLDTLKARYGV